MSMFIRYQSVRNAVAGAVVVLGGGGAAAYHFFGEDSVPVQPQPAALAQFPAAPQAAAEPAHVLSTAPVAPATSRQTQATAESAEVDRRSPELLNSADAPTGSSATAGNAAASMSHQQRYVAAMKIAMDKAPANGKGKDVLGAASPWKLNLYDDNNDGQWDRAKLDYDRDDVDDEKWNFKNGIWEKDGGNTVWSGTQWVVKSEESPGELLGAVTDESDHSVDAGEAEVEVDPRQARYEMAMKIATSPADADGKGKDVLGPNSPWKLNLYDDNEDGQWDRGKLDYDRDEVDDEKWNFKNGRWEKDGGATLWDGQRWVPSK
jgi:hypothetical protein